MKKALLFNIICFVIAFVALCCFICMLSWMPTEDLFMYYVFIVPCTLILFIFAIKIIIRLKSMSDNILKAGLKICNCLIIIILLGMQFEFYYFIISPNVNLSSRAEPHMYFNSENFVDYTENQETEYVEEAYVSNIKIYTSSNITVSKRINLTDEACVLTIDASYIDTNSFILKELKYMLYKCKYFKNADIQREGECIYIYYPGKFNTFTQNNQMTIMKKDKERFVFIHVESTSSSVPINKNRVISYCQSIEAL